MKTKQIRHGSDEHLSLLGAPYHWNLLTGVDRADMLAFGRACMEVERERGAKIAEKYGVSDFNDNGQIAAEIRDA